jgi:hypothetical protein
MILAHSWSLVSIGPLHHFRPSLRRGAASGLEQHLDRPAAYAVACLMVNHLLALANEGVHDLEQFRRRLVQRAVLDLQFGQVRNATAFRN